MEVKELALGMPRALRLAAALPTPTRLAADCAPSRCAPNDGGGGGGGGGVTGGAVVQVVRTTTTFHTLAIGFDCHALPPHLRPWLVLLQALLVSMRRVCTSARSMRHTYTFFFFDASAAAAGGANVL
jgi:hypothetical protein